MRGHHLKWIEGFLTGRQQKVVLDGKLSSPADILSGVPQMTVLGPLLFLLFKNDLPPVSTPQVQLIADDCTLNAESQRDANNFRADIDRLQQWESP